MPTNPFYPLASESETPQSPLPLGQINKCLLFMDFPVYKGNRITKGTTPEVSVTQCRSDGPCVRSYSASSAVSQD